MMKPRTNVWDKTAIVIGATGIIGQAITAALAKEGKWKVVAISRSGAPVTARKILSQLIYSIKNNPIANLRHSLM
jgi:NAD(P)-dependent dehydrogenase (short-subunit alcohol dehydrogenase family)